MRRLFAVLLSVLLALSPVVAFAGSTTFSATAGSGITFAAPTNASGQLGSAFGTVCDGAASTITLANCMAVLGAVAATSGSNSGVFQISPNGIGGASSTPMPVSATTAQNAAGNPFYVSPASSSYFEVSATNGPNTNSNPIFQAQTDGSHGTVAVKASNTPAVTGDISEVVTISPNNTLVGLKDSGGTDMTNTTAHALNVSQPTAANLNATVVPGGSAIFEVSPTTAANTASNPFFVTPANNSFVQVSATNGANAKTNPIYAGIADGTNGPATVKAASTQSVAGDLSAVVQINPNQPNLTTALNVSAAPATATAWGIFTNNSTTSGQSGQLGMCATTTSAPGNTNAQTNWLSCTTLGSERADIASVVGAAAATAASGVLKVGVVGNAGSTVDSTPGSGATNAVNIQGVASMTAVTVTPASNATTTVQPAPANTTTGGYGAQTPATLTTATSQSYSAGNCIGGAFTAIAALGNNGQSGLLTNIKISSNAGVLIPVVVVPFSQNPTSSTCTDHSTFTVAAADVDKVIGQPITATLTVPVGTTPAYSNITFVPPLPFAAGSASKSIYIGLATGSGGFTSASTATDIHIEVGVEQQ